MSGLDWLVIAVGGLGGYALVSFLIQGRGEIDPVSVKPESPSEPAADWPDVLGVPRNADVVAIRAAYKRMLAQYHPDKVATLGPELRDLATRKSQDITEAYRTAMRARGEAP